jgi:hypothetical protein
VKLLVLAAGLASMRAAIDRHDVDEAARQGALAGPAIVGKALAGDRTAQLAAIAAAPRVEDRAELLPALAAVAGGADRRAAIPAARAALAIAKDFAHHELPDDLAPEDVAAWHDAWLAVAARGDRWIEVRTVALEVAAALGDVPLSPDPDPAVRLASIEVQPAPSAQRAELAAIVTKDIDDGVALAAAKILCSDGAAASIDPARLKSLGATCTGDQLRR